MRTDYRVEPLSPREREKALRLARYGCKRIDIARCLGLSPNDFGAAIQGDRELIRALGELNARRDRQ